MKAVHVIVRGRVQGVGFREWVRRMAEQRQLTGWVRNRTEGYVEALFAGEEQALQSMLDLCHKGPPSAFVIKVEISEAEVPVNDGFERLPTV